MCKDPEETLTNATLSRHILYDAIERAGEEADQNVEAWLASLEDSHEG